MKVNAEKLDKALHKLMPLIKSLKEVEKHIIDVKQDILKSIEDDNEEEDNVEMDKDNSD